MADRKGQGEGQHGAAAVLLWIIRWLDDIIIETSIISAPSMSVTYVLLGHRLDPADVVGLEVGGGVAATAVDEVFLCQQQVLHHPGLSLNSGCHGQNCVSVATCTLPPNAREFLRKGARLERSSWS